MVFEAPSGTFDVFGSFRCDESDADFGPGATGDTGDVFKVVVSNGSSTATSNTAALFVGPLAQVPDFATRTGRRSATPPRSPGCSYQLTASTNNQHGELVWPTLVATDDMTLSFTVTLSNPSSTPADGFTIVLGDPSLGATPTSIGMVGQGLGAQGIPGLVFEFDDYHNAGEPPVPYFAVTRGESAQFENPLLREQRKYSYVGCCRAVDHARLCGDDREQRLTVTLDGAEVVNTLINPPPIAYLYVTASTGGS